MVFCVPLPVVKVRPVSYGPLGLELMRSGKSAEQALTSLLAVDAHEDVRQVGMVDRYGSVANHTGAELCVLWCKDGVPAWLLSGVGLLLAMNRWSLTMAETTARSQVENPY